MPISRHHIQSYYFGQDCKISNRIILIKRAERLCEYSQHLSKVIHFGNVFQGLTGQINGNDLTVLSCGIGPSMVGDCVFAINNYESMLLFSGTTGGLSDNIKIGDYVVATEAICWDGFSALCGYPQGAIVNGDKSLSDKIRQQIMDQQLPYHVGRVFTTASCLREVDDDFWDLVPKNCIAIDMSTAAFYAAAAKSGKKAIAYYWVTDIPRSEKSFFGSFSIEESSLKQKRFKFAPILDIELAVSM